MQSNDLFEAVLRLIAFAAGYITGCIVMHYYEKSYRESEDKDAKKKQ